MYVCTWEGGGEKNREIFGQQRLFSQDTGFILARHASEHSRALSPITEPFGSSLCFFICYLWINLENVTNSLPLSLTGILSEYQFHASSRLVRLVTQSLAERPRSPSLARNRSQLHSITILSTTGSLTPQIHDSTQIRARIGSPPNKKDITILYSISGEGGIPTLIWISISRDALRPEKEEIGHQFFPAFNGRVEVPISILSWVDGRDGMAWLLHLNSFTFQRDRPTHTNASTHAVPGGLANREEYCNSGGEEARLWRTSCI